MHYVGVFRRCALRVFRFCRVIGLALPVLFGTAAWAQLPIPPGALQQLDRAIGQRVEAIAVVGTQSVASRSGLGWSLNDADGNIYKIPWKTELREPRAIGSSSVAWTPVFEGGAGYGDFVNRFEDNVLAGNQSKFETVAVSLGAGPRFYFGTNGFSVLPAFDFLYAYTHNDFIPGTPAGQDIVADGRYVNWDVHTISFVPSMEVRYRRTFGRWTPMVVSGFAYFKTQPIYRSTDDLSFRSESMVWANRIELDFLTNLKLFSCPVHLGADISRTDLYDGLRTAMNTSYYYQTRGSVTLDVLNKVWKADVLGVSGGYFWCGAFEGYSIGLEASLKF
jgi:hypothetical protein